jgi:PAS domain S-box-containing protein
MKLLYLSAWVVIIAFFVWSGNLLVDIQQVGVETGRLHDLRLHLDSLAGAWRDLNRPGNDVLENYEVADQRAAFAFYTRRYENIRERVQERVQDDPSIAPLVASLDPFRDAMIALATEILSLAQQRETLRRAQAPAEDISAKETAAATAMARMDQVFQSGLDVILEGSTTVVAQGRALERSQRAHFKLLYIMLMVTLLLSALSLELIRHSVRQRNALRSSSARINTIVNNVLDGIVAVDEHGRIESVNQAAERMFGYSGDELVGQAFAGLLDERCAGAYRSMLRAAPGEAVIHSFFCEECEGGLGRRRDGSTFPIELAISRVKMKGGRLSIHIVRDVTERNRADQGLRLAASVFDNASEGIVVTDVNGTIQSVNPAFTAITGYSVEALIGENPRLLKSGKQDAEFYREMWQAIAETGHWRGEIWNRRENGEMFPQWLTINAIKDSRGRTTNYVGVVWDISELKAEQRKKEEFITMVSHELRTPLTSVLGALGMIRENMAAQIPQQAQRLVALAHSNSRRLVRLISDILDMEKIEAGKMTFEFEPVELVALVGQVIEDGKALAEASQVEIRLTASAPEAWVNGDADRLMQALTNLLSNAITFSPPGNPIEVSLGTRDEFVHVEVTDHGPGIPEEFRNEIFTKFAQASGTRTGRKAGTGLGLSIAKVIIQHHGGRIDYRTQANDGTSFFIDLPRLAVTSADHQSEPPEPIQSYERQARS